MTDRKSKTYINEDQADKRTQGSHLEVKHQEKYANEYASQTCHHKFTYVRAPFAQQM